MNFGLPKWLVQAKGEESAMRLLKGQSKLSDQVSIQRVEECDGCRVLVAKWRTVVIVDVPGTRFDTGGIPPDPIASTRNEARCERCWRDGGAADVIVRLPYETQYYRQRKKFVDYGGVGYVLEPVQS